MSYTICSRFKGEHIVYAGYTICTSREHIVYGAFCGSTTPKFTVFEQELLHGQASIIGNPMLPRGSHSSAGYKDAHLNQDFVSSLFLSEMIAILARTPLNKDQTQNHHIQRKGRIQDF